MYGIAVFLNQKIHNQFFGTPIHQLGTDSHLISGLNMIRCQVLYQLLSITEEVGKNVFPGFGQGHGPEFCIGEK